MRKLLPDSHLETYSDEDLLVNIHSKDGHKSAGELYKRYAHLVNGICMKYLKNSANSNDVMMDIFEKFLKNPPIGDVLSFKKWLFTVTKHECLTFLRNSKRSEGQEEQWKDFEKKSENFMENEDVWSLNNKTSDVTVVQDALKQLKEPQQVCLQLFYVEGKSYKEIEEKTDFDLNQIKSHLQNGKRKLKLLVERH
ncbi:MAG: RNA polymerase sigma factor (sigma-70 family) [Saprospiraceae bacterium]|jgi:RNA polymerase sigma factor (sigma-70 family)